jgi:hypothetical protein
MSVGCPHDPLNTCAGCLSALSSGDAAFFATSLKPNPEESMSDFAARVKIAETIAATDPAQKEPESAPAYAEPSLEEQKRIIRDENIPEPIRRFWRQRLYGAGGSGRKAVQQERLKAQVVISGQHRKESVTKALHGKQKKIARRLLRQAAKIMQGASSA